MTVSASCALTPLPDVAGPASAPNVSRRATNPYLNFDSLLATPRKRRTRQ
jgi:hypothetical protein